MTDEPSYFDEINFEEEMCRAMQIRAALPHIAPLLDRWENMSNDVKSSLRIDDDYFCELMDALEEAWMSDGTTDAVGSSPDSTAR